MQKKFIAYTHIICRYHERHSVSDEPDMANKRLIQNAVNSFSVECSAVRLPRNCCSFCWCEVAHAPRLAPVKRSRKRQSGTGFSLCSFLLVTKTDRQECLSHYCFAATGFAAPRTTRNPIYSGAGVQLDSVSAGQSALPPINLPLPSRVKTHSATFPPRS